MSVHKRAEEVIGARSDLSSEKERKCMQNSKGIFTTHIISFLIQKKIEICSIPTPRG
jgi:hypothetical protein